MNLELQSRIEAAVALNWDAFSSLHPALSQVIDKAALTRQVRRSLCEDPEFTRAYRAAVEANVSARAMASFVEQFVGPAMRRLL